MFREDSEGVRINDCENCSGVRMAQRKCIFTPDEYESAKVPIDLRNNHAKVAAWLDEIDYPGKVEMAAIDVADQFSMYEEMADDDKRELCFKLKPESRFAIEYVVSYRTDGMGAPKYRTYGGTYDQLKRDIDADNIICGAMTDASRRVSETGS